ncbi:alpha/beta hydrolase [Fredinandcohnia sp. SECRCQ15]|uniref:Alpha/beta hydrolase n=2 Tax=Fredinandcohnia quinoae TaxID=2918902 RepID=A0AAW5DW25_9BACI|nr:alpha/beta hydrolase [Fredinandcohnia sp. SECRCQ15]MCH1624840.1 alpha/beta hydrolase [Fredinandcohnia sp. SECRCQ15]
MKNFKKLFITIGVILGYVITVGTFFTNKVMYIKKKSDETILKRELTEGRFTLNEVSALQKEEIEVNSKFGYLIKGWFVRATNENKKFIIISHGVTMNKINSIKYMKIFLRLGWNVIIYDQRRHGETGGKTTSYGHYEKFDLKSVVDWVKQQFGNNITLGIHGESMGSVTTLLYAGMIEDGANFYITDCPFSDFEAQLRYRLKVEFKLPSLLVMPFANSFLKLRDGYTIKDVSPLSVIKNIKNPVLFIHSAEDDYILPEMTKELYDMKEGPKKLFIAERGRHAYSYAENKDEYEYVIKEFLSQYVKD